jgi:hypothetical protein
MSPKPASSWSFTAFKRITPGFLRAEQPGYTEAADASGIGGLFRTLPIFADFPCTESIKRTKYHRNLVEIYQAYGIIGIARFVHNKKEENL